MSAPVEVTPEHIQRAYAQMHKHGMPSLDELRSHWALYCCIRNRALGIAQGKTLPPEPVAAPPPSPPVRAGPPHPERRRTDAPTAPAPYSSRAAAAGEYVHPDEA
ncbi:MAG: hypothetical protein SHS37scaffold296_30 [Burkholderiales phage 68_11]|jgi:hypothetical protein|nr:MAG: hypothetical protein SHS37scaffold296_30 [Burkholderiales phage 68_11]